VRASSAERSAAAAQRIERWLLTSPIQLAGGAHDGGIAGTLDAEGRPTFVYLEITGYYLTWAAWVAAGGGCLAESGGLAVQRARRALGWLERVVDEQRVPPTRQYLLDSNVTDWRNSAVFTFDLAMAIRGAATFSSVSMTTGRADSPVLRALASQLDACRNGERVLQSHRAVNDDQIPHRWSTTSGPHHLKAAASLLTLPVSKGLCEAARNTTSYWSEELLHGWPVTETHPLLYGLEGMVICGGDQWDGAAAVFERLMTSQDDVGSLPSQVSGEAIERSDVLAQALRIGALLRGHGCLQGSAWLRRLDLLAERLVAYVHPDGSLGFARGHDNRNVWCAMFAHQALLWHQRLGETAPDVAQRFLV
jgi:hypothetical protein